MCKKHGQPAQGTRFKAIFDGCSWVWDDPGPNYAEMGSKLSARASRTGATPFWIVFIKTRENKSFRNENPSQAASTSFFIHVSRPGASAGLGWAGFRMMAGCAGGGGSGAARPRIRGTPRVTVWRMRLLTYLLSTPYSPFISILEPRRLYFFYQSIIPIGRIDSCSILGALRLCLLVVSRGRKRKQTLLNLYLNFLELGCSSPKLKSPTLSPKSINCTLLGRGFCMGQS